MLATIAIGYVVAAIGSGPIAGRIGIARVIFFASFLYGGGYVVAGLAESWHDWYYAALFPIGVAGGTVMTQAWALLFKLMPAEERGAIAGPRHDDEGDRAALLRAAVAGAAITLVAPYLPETHGYQIVWPICGLPILAVSCLLADQGRKGSYMSVVIVESSVHRPWWTPAGQYTVYTCVELDGDAVDAGESVTFDAADEGVVLARHGG